MASERGADTYILARTTPASAAGGWRADLAVGALRVLLLDVGVERRVAEVGLRAVATLEVAPLYVILGASLAFAGVLPVLAVIVLLEVLSSRIVRPSLRVRPQILHLDWGIGHGADDMRIAPWVLVWGLRRGHHVLALPVVVVAHLHELVVCGAICSVARLSLVHTWVLPHHALAGRPATHHDLRLEVSCLPGGAHLRVLELVAPREVELGVGGLLVRVWLLHGLVVWLETAIGRGEGVRERGGHRIFIIGSSLTLIK